MVPPFLYSSPIPLLPFFLSAAYIMPWGLCTKSARRQLGEQRQWLSPELSTLVPFHPAASPFAAFHSPGYLSKPCFLTFTFCPSLLCFQKNRKLNPRRKKLYLAQWKSPKLLTPKGTQWVRSPVHLIQTHLFNLTPSPQGNPPMTLSLSCECSS